MPSKLHPMPGRLTTEERAQLTKAARAAGFSLGTYVRARLGLAPLPRGGARNRSKGRRRGDSSGEV